MASAPSNKTPTEPVQTQPRKLRYEEPKIGSASTSRIASRALQTSLVSPLQHSLHRLRTYPSRQSPCAAPLSLCAHRLAGIRPPRLCAA